MIKKFREYINESVVDLDAYAMIQKSKTYKKLQNGKYPVYDIDEVDGESFDNFYCDLEEEFKEVLDFGDTDVDRAVETIFHEYVSENFEEDDEDEEEDEDSLDED